VRPNGMYVERIPEASGTVMLLSDGIILVSKNQLILRRPDASELRFDLRDVLDLSALGEHYVEIRARGGLYALHTEPGRERLFVLPGNPK
jgi:hypothetical protein